MKMLDKADVEDLCMGATVLGTGGGGDPELGLFLLKRLLDMGKPIKLASVDEIPDDAVIVHPASVGSIAPSQGKGRDPESYCKRVLAEDGPLMGSLTTMEQVLGKRVYGTLPVEIGGYNTPVAAILAALAGIVFVDGDTIGRSKPELMMQTYTVLNIPITPMVLTDDRGNSVLVRKTADFRDAERIARSMAVIGGGTTAVRCPVDGKTLKTAAIPNGVSRAMAIGKGWREARASGIPADGAVIHASGGTELFKGTVSKFDWEDRDGFLWGTIFIDGDEKYRGHELKVWLKNENLVSWLDGAPYVVTPDLICIVDTDTGKAVTNTNMTKGLRLTVFAIPADPFWKTEKALDLVSPKHFDFDIPYVPMERIVRVW
jgi:uncharacterized protein